MAYVGSTAASTVANPPVRISHGILANRSVAESTSVQEGGNLWSYVSTNLTTSLMSSTYFTDAQRLGMRNGDVVISAGYSTESSTGSILCIGVITGVSSAGAGISTESYISSTALGGS